MWGDIFGCSIVARYITTERKDGDGGGEVGGGGGDTLHW